MTKTDIFNTVIRAVLNETVRINMAFSSTAAEESIIEQLKPTELTVLGLGLYSIVVSHPNYPERAFKVSTSRWDGYREFAKFCLERQGYSFIPNIYSMEVQGDFSWYELDLLNQLDLSSEPSTNDVIARQQEAFYIAESVFEGDEAAAWLDIDSDTRCNNYLDMQCLVELCNEIRSTYIGLYEVDFHDNNAMIDATGNFVLTDVLAKRQCVNIELTEDNPNL